MSKNAVAVKHEDQLPETVGLPAEISSFLLEDSGKGVSFAQEDNIVPLIYLLQANSPALKKSSPNYLEGSAAGDIWKRNSIHQQLIKGEEGFLFQPCHFEKVWLEWRPNRGGFAGSHPERPSDAKETEIMHEGKPRLIWVRKNGNQVVETRQHVGFANGEAYVISFSSTGHTVSRTWMQMMNQQYIPGTNKIAPSFSRLYKLTSVERTKDANSWFVFKVEDAGWVTKREDYEKGKALHEAFTRGEKKVANEELEEVLHDSSSVNDEEAPF